MFHSNPILEEKYRIQEMLSERAKDSHEYSKRAEEDVRKYFAEHNLKLNVQRPDRKYKGAKKYELVQN